MVKRLGVRRYGPKEKLFEIQDPHSELGGFVSLELTYRS